MTWPSPRRASAGGSLNPEPSNSPISSMPSARRGGLAPSVVVMVIARPVAVPLIDHDVLSSRRHGAAVALRDVAGHLDVGLASDVDVQPSPPPRVPEQLAEVHEPTGTRAGTGGN